MIAELDYDRILRRILRLMAVLGVLGAVIWSLVRGLEGFISFAGGAAISGVSFWLLHRLVSDLSHAAEGRKVRGASLFLHTFRLVILGGLAYAILRVYGVYAPALATGLLLAVTAATLEVLVELFYARA